MFNQKSTARYSRKMSVYFMLFVCVFMFLISVTTNASHCGSLGKAANDALKDWANATTAFGIVTATAACNFSEDHPSPETVAACGVARVAQLVAGAYLGITSANYYKAAKAYGACLNEHSDSGTEN